jgi:hypothetical protein
VSHSRTLEASFICVVTACGGIVGLCFFGSVTLGLVAVLDV